MSDPVTIAQSLIRCRSVTPAEGGALRFLERLLKDAGFEAQRVTFEAPGMPPVENLFAKIGSGAPHLAFAGHTDVVPPGDEARWKHGAFAGEVKDGVLYGRGAVDMKGGIAAFAAAALDYADRLCTGSFRRPFQVLWRVFGRLDGIGPPPFREPPVGEPRGLRRQHARGGRRPRGRQDRQRPVEVRRKI